MKKIAEQIQKAKSIIILPHIFPDVDAMGSSYAAKELFENMNKNCTIVTEDKMPEYVSECCGGEYEIFDREKKYVSDLVLCLDCADTGRLGQRVTILESASVSANIDHHKTNTQYAQYNCFDSSAAATAMLIYELFGILKQPLTQTSAKNLYTAIVGDTGNFKYSNVTPKTFETAAKLISFDIKHWEISKKVFDTEKLDYIKLKGELSKELEVFADGKICAVTAKKDIFERYGVLSSEIDALVDIARKVKGVEVAISFKETSKGIKVSLRSAEYADVSKAASVFGGGGHARASGFMIDIEDVESLDKTKQEVIDEVLKII